MKTKRISLLGWVEHDPRETIEIDWPMVHRELGEEQVKWFLAHPVTECQLVIDKVNDSFRLVAEFYDEKTLTLYHLMWAK
jgi:hypothetical protein